MVMTLSTRTAILSVDGLGTTVHLVTSILLQVQLGRGRFLKEDAGKHNPNFETVDGLKSMVGNALLSIAHIGKTKAHL